MRINSFRRNGNYIATYELTGCHDRWSARNIIAKASEVFDVQFEGASNPYTGEISFLPERKEDCRKYEIFSAYGTYCNFPCCLSVHCYPEDDLYILTVIVNETESALAGLVAHTTLSLVHPPMEEPCYQKSF